MTGKKLMIKKGTLEKIKEDSQTQAEKKRAKADAKWNKLLEARREKSEALQAAKDKERANIIAAEDADKDLAEAISEYQSLHGVDKVLKSAEGELEKAEKWQSDLSLLLAQAKKAVEEAEINVLKIKQKIEDYDELRERVRAGLEDSNKAWDRFGRAFRKKHRDRSVKKAAVEILKK